MVPELKVGERFVYNHEARLKNNVGTMVWRGELGVVKAIFPAAVSSELSLSITVRLLLTSGAWCHVPLLELFERWDKVFRSVSIAPQPVVRETKVRNGSRVPCCECRGEGYVYDEDSGKRVPRVCENCDGEGTQVVRPRKENGKA